MLRLLALVTVFTILAGNSLASGMPEADAKYGPWWEGISSSERISVTRFCIGFRALTAQEQREVFYFDNDAALEAWKVCYWLYINGYLTH